MKPLLSLFLVVLVFLLSLYPANITILAQAVQSGESVENIRLQLPEFDRVKPVYSESDYQFRISGLSDKIDFSYNKYVKSHIEAYLRYQEHTERILGKTTVYFPLFEDYLKKYDLPEELKFLPIIESALNPNALSPVGAAGLWQFMPYTGAEYNLNINAGVDERLDPHLASDAAARFLKDLNNRYDDWLLSIAAYNCGPGRVNKAIRRAKSKDIWKVYPYLPRETRGYIPAFISVAYLVNYYHLHNLDPIYPPVDQQVTETLKIYDQLNFIDIVKKCDVDMETLSILNPAFKHGYIPASMRGYNLTLPAGKIALLNAEDPIDEIAMAQNITPPGEKFYFQEIDKESPVYYEIRRGETLWDVARYYPGVSVNDLIRVNRLTNLNKIKPGVQIRIPSA